MNGIELPVDIPGHRMRHAIGPVEGDGVFLVGEAAGGQEPVLWEGIRWALLTGIGCARSILSNTDYQTWYDIQMAPLLRWRNRITSMGRHVKNPALWRLGFGMLPVSKYFLG